MNLFQKIKALWAIKGFVEDATKEAKKMTNAKPGYLTTEFWMTILTNIVTLVGALKGVIPDQAAAIILASANGIYGVVRAITKQGASPTQ